MPSRKLNETEYYPQTEVFVYIPPDCSIVYVSMMLIQCGPSYKHIEPKVIFYISFFPLVCITGVIPQ